MQTERLIQGARKFGLDLTDQQVQQFTRYYELLVEWNEKINLTAITAEEEVIDKHFLDSLSGAQVFSVTEGMKILDVGTGGGFPGMALAIAFPEAQVCLMDATGKKVRFLEMTASELGLKNVTAVQGRAEEMAHDPAYREQFDLVTSRAVAALPVLLEYMAGFVKPQGQIAAYKGPSLEEEMQAAAGAIKTLGLTPENKQVFQIADQQHTVAVFIKKKALADRYPRPQAQIRKKAL